MVEVKPILGTAVGLQGVALMGRAYQMVPKKWGPRAKPISTKKMVKGFMDLNVGTALIRPTATIVNTF